MPIIYDGFLQSHIVRWINDFADDYGHVLELSSLPPNWMEWTEKNLDDYHISREDCQGHPYSDKTKKYGLIRRDQADEALFLFLKSQKEKAAVIRDFPELIVNESPFKTILR